MLREKPKLFTIGQFAALHGINKKTLMWYDEIGLFKPAFIHEENGYRLYSYYQSTELEVILLLRDMNVPIRDIQEFMKNRSAGSMADLLRDKISELDRTIQGLKAVRSKLCSRRQEMTELLDLDLSEISLIEREPQYLATVQTSPEKSLEDEIEPVSYTHLDVYKRQLFRIAARPLRRLSLENPSELFWRASYGYKYLWGKISNYPPYYKQMCIRDR